MWFKNNTISPVTVLLTVLLLTLSLSAEAEHSAVVFRGRTTHALNYCPVVLPLDSISEFTTAQRDSLVVYLNGNELPSQLDDTNADGVPDELSFLVSLSRHSRYTLEIRTSSQRPTYPQEVWAEMYLKGPIGGDFQRHTAEGKTYGIKAVSQQTFYPADKSFRLMHHHGVAFESEEMAYRIYFDPRQTIDVYAKRHPQLELQQSLWYPNDSLLTLGYGDDVLKVGNTIGVGSVRPWQNNKLNKIQPFTSRTQRIISRGPIRTIVEVEVRGWQPVPSSPDTVTMRLRYTLFAHHRDAFCEVFLSSPVPSLVTGVQRVGNGPSKYIDCSVASWGTDWPVNDTIKYPKETIGLAVYVPKVYHAQQVGDALNTLIQLQPTTYLCFHLTVVSLKENNPPATTPRQFWSFVTQWQQTLLKNQSFTNQLLSTSQR